MEILEVLRLFDGIERIVLSIAIAPLIGLVLERTPYGMLLPGMLASLILVAMLFLGIYIYRRKNGLQASHCCKS